MGMHRDKNAAMNMLCLLRLQLCNQPRPPPISLGELTQNSANQRLLCRVFLPLRKLSGSGRLPHYHRLW